MNNTRQGLRGIVHAHSSRSFDGSYDYATLRALLSEAHLDFACMTEHIENLGQGDIDTIIRDCAAHSDERFLFIPGIEMDCFTIYFLGVRPAQVDFTDERSVYRSLRRNARLCVLSHPIKTNYDYPQWILDDCDAVEIMNAKHDGRFYFRPQSERLLSAVRRARPQVVPVIGLDFHNRQQLCQVHMRLTREGALSSDFVLGEIEAGSVAFYNGDQCLDHLPAFSKRIRRAQIYLMDLAHLINRTLQRSGIKLPKVLRRAVARVVEGG